MSTWTLFICKECIMNILTRRRSVLQSNKDNIQVVWPCVWLNHLLDQLAKLGPRQGKSYLVGYIHFEM